MGDKVVGKPFKPGVSGNPSGRPKVVAEVQELARIYTEEAIKALVQIATKGKSEAARVSASVAILDRGYGRPPQTIDTKVTANFVGLSDDELRGHIARELAAGGANGAGAPPPVDPSQLN